MVNSILSAHEQLRRKPDENEEKYLWRLGQAKESGLYELSWDDISDIMNSEFRTDESEYRNESAYRKPYQQAKRFFDAGIFEARGSAQTVGQVEFDQAKRECMKERVKLQTEKLEYSRWLREDARDELILEKIIDAVRIEGKRDYAPTNARETVVGRDDAVGVLCYGDEHYGAEFKITGLHGETINEYSPEIFRDRMERILSIVKSKVEFLGLKKLKVYSMGDELDGVLRVKQLKHLRCGVIDSAVQYGFYMSDWLRRLTEIVDEVELHMVAGNHTELRMIGQPKGTFEEENMSKVVRAIIKTKLEDNWKFKLVENPTGLIFDTVYGLNILGIHGEVKNMAQAIEDFSNTYKTNIDILIGGHKHHAASETVGIDRDVVSIPSIMGVDNFSMSINKSSNAGTTFLVMQDGLGITEQHNIRL